MNLQTNTKSTIINQILKRWMIIFNICFIGTIAQARLYEGHGTDQRPFLIYTEEELHDIARNPSDWSGYFQLMNDLDLTAYPGLCLGPGRGISAFRGEFDGKNHTIFNFSSTRGGKTYVGLFGAIGKGGEVKNLTLSNVELSGGSNIGGLVGRNNGTITNCSIEAGNISSEEYGRYTRIGGLVGHNLGIVCDCYTQCTISGEGMIGGLVGDNQGGTIIDCIVSVDLDQESTGDNVVGGLVGQNSGRISRCFATGQVHDTGVVGGLVGKNIGEENQSTLTKGVVFGCFAEVNVQGRSCGGLVGSNASIISNSYASGNVQGQNSMSTGGLVGEQAYSAIIYNCYASGQIHNGGPLVGFTLGDNVKASFWSIEPTGQNFSTTGIKLTPAEAQDIRTYQYEGWDFMAPDDGPDNIWVMPDQGYPQLWWEQDTDYGLPSFGNGSGTTGDPYLISNPDELNNIGCNPRLMNKYFKLVKDINLSEIDYFPIGEQGNSFVGHFDGNGCTISNLVHEATADEYAGLFGYIGQNGEVQNLGLKEAKVKGQVYVGGLVGLNEGMIKHCYVTQTNTLFEGIEGDYPVESFLYMTGGIAGYNKGDIYFCYATANVWNGGGVVGWNEGKVYMCYAAGPVAGTGTTGGLVAVCRNNNELVIASYWDKQVSGQQESAGGIGKTTDEMKCIQTYQAQGQWDEVPGWDFALGNDGPDNIWVMSDGGYPQLWWQHAHEISLPVLGGGKGTEADPYLISEPHHLAAMGANPQLMDKHFMLTDDINMVDVKFFPIGDKPNPFNGHFDGSSHIIMNLKYAATWPYPKDGYVGLFGHVGIRGYTEKLALRQVNFGGWYVGALGGLSSGKFSQCSAEGTIQGSVYAGGLIGQHQEGTLSDCYAKVEINRFSNSQYSTGGLVGLSDAGTIVNCYAAGYIGRDEPSKGLVGCYHDFYDKFGKTINSFLDLNMSVLDICEIGKGLSTAKMQDINTYLKVGWDFTGEIENGIEDIWWIDDGRDYPHLWCEVEGK